MQAFWQPVFPKIQLWRTALGFVLLILAFLGATFAAFRIGAAVMDTDPAALLGGGTPGALVVFFATFWGFHLGLLVLLPVLHKRGYASLFGAARRLNLSHFGIGLLVTLALALLLYSLMFAERLFLPPEIEPQLRQIRALADWAVFLPVALILIFLQTFAEEALFRGYLLQQLRARFASVFVWAVLPSLVFGLLHFDAGTYGVWNAAAYVVNTTATGIMLCLITLRTGNLGAAAGLHFGNNAALVLIGIDGNLDGFSLFVVSMQLESGYTAWSILSQTAISLVLFTLWWLWMNRRDKIANAANPS